LLRGERWRASLRALRPLAFDLPGFAIAPWPSRWRGGPIGRPRPPGSPPPPCSPSRPPARARGGRQRPAAGGVRAAVARGAALAAGAPEPSGSRSILAERRGILAFSHFQLEPSPRPRRHSFHAGADGTLAEGVPRAPLPPSLPGFHKREPWLALERALVVEGERLPCACGAIRAGSRPRAVPLLDGLVPAMAASVRGGLLERRANVDRLTGGGLPARFETRLAQVLRRRDEARAGPGGRRPRPLQAHQRTGATRGDMALAAVARVLVGPSRGRGCARWGGEEFVPLLEDTDGETALEIAEAAPARGGDRARVRRRAGAAVDELRHAVFPSARRAPARSCWRSPTVRSTPPSGWGATWRCRSRPRPPAHRLGAADRGRPVAVAARSARVLRLRGAPAGARRARPEFPASEGRTG
jgi:hypothetical protein